MPPGELNTMRDHSSDQHAFQGDNDLGELDPFRLGVSEGEFLDLSSLEEIQFHLQNMIAQASHKVRILSPDLEHSWYDNDGFADMLSRFARSSRFAEVRILVHDIEPAIKNGHSILELARRLSSKILIRRSDSLQDSKLDHFLLADNSGLISKNGQDHFASANYNSRYRVKLYAEAFDQIWHRSQLPIELRHIAL